MAKVAFSKFGLKVNQEVKTVEFNDQMIEVKQYIPVNEKLTMMGEVLDYSSDANNFSNPVKKEVYTQIVVIEHYTNITFTEKQKDDIAKLYDTIRASNLYEVIVKAIPEQEYDELLRGINGIIDAFYKYRNSVLGILDVMKTDYTGLDMDLASIIGQIKDPEALEILKNIAPAMTGLNQSISTDENSK